MAHSATIPSRKKRSTAINAVSMEKGDNAALLIQWHYTQSVYNDVNGKCKLHGFRSIVTRPGLPGLWLDRPYYCYAGEHHYRRLPTGLAMRIYVYRLNGWLHRARRSGRTMASHTMTKALYWSPAAVYNRHKARRELNEWNKRMSIDFE